MQELYDRGIYTGWALAVEMIERGDIRTLPELADHLRQMYQHKITDRQQLVNNHSYAMQKVINRPKNVAKGGWQGMDTYDLLMLMEDEIGELTASIWNHIHHGGSIEDVEAEGADISVFVAMITDNLKRRQTPCNVKNADHVCA